MKNYNLNFSNFVFVLISVTTLYVLIYNILHYNPILGYDGEAHFNYVDYVSRYLPNEIRLPSKIDTREYFSPPLGYLVPSIAQVICRNVIESNNFLLDCRPIYGKATQIFQSFMYIVTIIINLYTLKIFNKSNSFLNTGYLLLVSLFAVNYRTISMIRGEPYILFFLSLFLIIIYKAENIDYELNLKLIFSAGIIIACISLSRQWGFLLFIPLVFLLFFHSSKRKYFLFWFTSSLIGALSSAWFYIGLYQKYGTITAFNMDSERFSFSNQKLSFYIPNIEDLEYLFNKPIRPNLDNQFFSILYSDLWGDYWGYFVFTSRHLDIGRNQLLVGNYLARVNIVSVVTSLLIVSFCYFVVKKFKSNFFINYLNYAIIFSFVGFLLFAIIFPTNGDTIKASYIIQAFHLIAFLASIYFYNLSKTNSKMYHLLLSILVIIYFHNFQSYLSHYPSNFLP
tara:strand:- start:1718 stop:3073 length:1356 start_codon:yes stop_codon:yes gene_type:complete